MKKKNYTEKDMRDALRAFEKTKKLRQSAKLFNEPWSSLKDRIDNRYPVKTRTVLPKETEELIANSLIKLAEWGFGRNRNEVLDLVKDHLMEKKISNVFKDGKPGKKWYKLFLKRWPVLSERKAQNISRERAVASTPEIINNFFEIIATAYAQIGEIDPQDVYNCDEIRFNGEQKARKIICHRTSKNVHKLQGDNSKTMYTVLSTCNAAGFYLAPFVVYKSKYLYNDWVLGGPPNTSYSNSKSGWMETEQFTTWFKSKFVIHCNRRKTKKVLFVDGHNSHISVEVIELAIANNIVIICLPAHITH